MITESQVKAATAAAEHYAAAGATWPQALQHITRALIHRLASARDLPNPDLPYPKIPAAETALDAIGPLTDWTVLTIGDVHQELLRLELVDGPDRPVARRPRGSTTRDLQGAWYTPDPLAQATSRLGLEVAISRLLEDDDPEQIFRLRVVDPACGAGVLLLEGARFLADAYARRLAGTDHAPPLLVRKVMPEVLYRCVFGMDIDPVAVDLAKTVLWLEIDGAAPFTWLDGNIARLDAMEGPEALPDRLRDAMSHSQLPAVTLPAA